MTSDQGSWFAHRWQLQSKAILACNLLLTLSCLVALLTFWKHFLFKDGIDIAFILPFLLLARPLGAWLVPCKDSRDYLLHNPGTALRNGLPHLLGMGVFSWLLLRHPLPQEASGLSATLVADALWSLRFLSGFPGTWALVAAYACTPWIRSIHPSEPKILRGSEVRKALLILLLSLPVLPGIATLSMVGDYRQSIEYADAAEMRVRISHKWTVSARNPNRTLHVVTWLSRSKLQALGADLEAINGPSGIDWDDKAILPRSVWETLSVGDSLDLGISGPQGTPFFKQDPPDLARHRRFVGFMALQLILSLLLWQGVHGFLAWNEARNLRTSRG